jgi:hypothetical protein
VVGRAALRAAAAQSTGTDCPRSPGASKLDPKPINGCSGVLSVGSLLSAREAGNERIRKAVLLGPVGADENTSDCEDEGLVCKAPKFGG